MKKVFSRRSPSALEVKSTTRAVVACVVMSARTTETHRQVTVPKVRSPHRAHAARRTGRTPAMRQLPALFAAALSLAIVACSALPSLETPAARADRIEAFPGQPEDLPLSAYGGCAAVFSGSLRI